VGMLCDCGIGRLLEQGEGKGERGTGAIFVLMEVCFKSE
jgi:hypothetical protein